MIYYYLNYSAKLNSRLIKLYFIKTNPYTLEFNAIEIVWQCLRNIEKMLKP